MKEWICTILGVIGSAIAGAFGGWDIALIALITSMAVDYVSGLIVAGVFKKSSKTESGALESHAGWKGLCRKGMTLLLVLISHMLDLVIGATYIRDAVCIAFMVNEVISIVENAGLMGMPIPTVLKSAIDILQKKSEREE